MFGTEATSHPPATATAAAAVVTDTVVGLLAASILPRIFLLTKLAGAGSTSTVVFITVTDAGTNARASSPLSAIPDTHHCLILQVLALLWAQVGASLGHHYAAIRGA